MHIKSWCTIFHLKDEIEIMNLGERYQKVLLMIEQQEFYQKKIDNLNLPKLKEDFDKASEYLKDEYREIHIFDTNIIVKNSLNDYFTYINKSCFVEWLSDEEKEQNYSKIKKFLLADLKSKKLLNQMEFYKKSLINETQTHNFDKPKGNHSPKEIADFLCKLCENDEKKIERFAVLTFNLLYAPERSTSTVIYAKKELHAALNDYLNLIFCNRCWRINLLQLSQSENCSLLPLYNFVKNPSVIIIDDKDMFSTEPYVSTFRKIINGKSLKINNPYFKDEMIIKNRIPVICITDNQQSYLTMKNLYKSKGIEFTSNETTRLPYDCEIIDWLRSEFTYLGYVWSTKNNIQHFKITEFDYLATVNEFLEKYCVFGDDLQCTKKELHEAYYNYFIKHFDVEPLSQIKFCRKVSELKFDKIETFRPHTNRQTYLHSFKGISLNKELCNELLTTQSNSQKKKEYENIKKHLDKAIDDVCNIECV